jgi:arabinose-5-phosphate isomerase
MTPSQRELEFAREILDAEARAIVVAKDRLGPEFVTALDLITTSVKSGGKVVVTGVGKSGKVASKVAATLTSTGTLAMFIHATEAVHGDLGVVTGRDVALLFSNSGSSDEVVRLVPSFKRLGMKIIAIVGNSKSTLAQSADVFISSQIEREADPHNLAPTSSTTVSIALGDAIALCLMKRWDFKPEQFAVFHPAGALGRRLTLKVSDLMKTNGQLGWVEEGSAVEEVVATATKTHLGAVLVRQNGTFTGIITDGDIRRSLGRKSEFFNLKASDLMTRNPSSITPDSRAEDALKLMENRPSPISVLPVVDATGQCVGLIRLHDLIGQI